MKTWWERFRGWQRRRYQLSMERWAKTRSKGATRFVIQIALIYSLLMILLRMASDFLDEGTPFTNRLTLNIIYYCAGGILVGLVSWWSMEGRYKNAKLEERIKAGMKQ
jgi:hypothetical protein